MARVGTFVRKLWLFAALAMMVPVVPALGATGKPATTVAKPSGKAPSQYRDAASSRFLVRRDIGYSGAKATADAMARARVPVVFETLRGAGHVPWQYRSRFITHSAYFLVDELGL
jgi:hypothetical protein